MESVLGLVLFAALFLESPWGQAGGPEYHPSVSSGGG